MTFTRRFAVSFVVVLFAAAAFAQSNAGKNPFEGKWKENIARSTYKPGPPPKNAMVFTFQGVPNGLKYVADNVTDKGEKEHVEITARFDGKDYPVKALLDGKPDPYVGEMLSAKRIDDHTIDYDYKTKGKVVYHGHSVLSSDGKIQTHTATAFDAEGKTVGTYTVIYERQ